MTQERQRPFRRRAPHGARATMHISLMPEERDRVKALAARDMRSEGNTARLLLLRGLKNFDEESGQSLAP